MNCALHPQRWARRTCRRCGRSLCTKCAPLFYGSRYCSKRCETLDRVRRELSRRRIELKLFFLPLRVSLLTPLYRYLLYLFERLSSTCTELVFRAEFLRARLYSSLKEFLSSPIFRRPERTGIRRSFPLQLSYRYGLFLSIASLSFFHIYSGLEEHKPRTPAVLGHTRLTQPSKAAEDRSTELQEILSRQRHRVSIYVKVKEPSGPPASPKVKSASFEPLSHKPSVFDRDKRGPKFTVPPDITRGSTERMEIALTFDAGWNNAEARHILDILKERSIKTTIFVTGRFIEKNPELVRRMVREGHEVANHTMDHPHLTSYALNYKHNTLPGVDRNFIVKELRETARLFKEVTGKDMAPLWRAPYGEVNREIRRWAFEAGYIHVGWTIDPKTGQSLDTLDWVRDTSSPLYQSALEIKQRILGFGSEGAGLRGGIILMHLGTTRETDRASDVLGPMLDEIMARGYRIVKVSELIEGLDSKRFKPAHLVLESFYSKGRARGSS